MDPPAPYPDVLTVGAVDRQRRVTDFSSRGPAPDGVASRTYSPRARLVLSAMPGRRVRDAGRHLDGHAAVAGVVALMWSANPALVGDLERTRAILRDTAQPVPQPAEACGGPRDVSGAGLVDAYAAVRAARAAATG